MRINWLSWLKTKTSTLRLAIWQSNKIIFRIIRPIYQLIRFSYYFCISHNYRSDSLYSLKYHRHYYQPNSLTTYNRYPDLFMLCKNYFTKHDSIKILSFGCSTGEEVFSLNQYMPQAQIVGVDINRYCLKKASRKNNHPNITFMHSLSLQYQASLSYDAVFCLAVLQHTKNRDKFRHVAYKFTFQKFEAQIAQLDSKLKLNGLLFIDYCDFNFLDTTFAQKYTPLAVTNNKITRDRPLYGINNLRVSESWNLYRIFVKMHN